MVTDAWAEKEQKEAEMKHEWLMEKGYDNMTFPEDIEAMPNFEYYDFVNWILCNYYPYMTIGCQGGAFLAGCLYRCDRSYLLLLSRD